MYETHFSGEGENARIPGISAMMAKRDPSAFIFFYRVFRAYLTESRQAKLVQHLKNWREENRRNQ